MAEPDESRAAWWDRCDDDPMDMLGCHEEFPRYRRKWRLFVQNCLAMIDRLSADPSGAAVINGIGVAADEDWPAVSTVGGISDIAGRFGWVYRDDSRSPYGLLDAALVAAAYWCDSYSAMDRFVTQVHEFAGKAVIGKHCNLIRELLSNPFRPIAFAPEWRTSTAVALAESMYAARDFGPMPVLADALEEAGCDHPDILIHCRSDGPHVRGCWVVDLVLGKS